LNPNHLLTFSVVARLKSITRAAKHLHIGQPAVSGQLKLLQDTVGEPLYYRKGHQIILSSVGEGLLDYANRLAEDLQQAREYVRCLQTLDAGILRIGSTMTIASYYLPQYLVQLQTQHPGTQVFMTTGSTREIIQKQSDLDLGFIEGPVIHHDIPTNYQMLPWKDDEIVLVLHKNHKLAKQYKKAVPLEVFAQHQVIWREAESGARQVVETALAEAGIVAPINIEVTGVDGIKESVRAGLGISFASFQALKNESTELVSRRINPPEGLIWHLSIIAPKEKFQSRIAGSFIDVCTT